MAQSITISGKTRIWCERCDRFVERTGSRQKYCKDCAREVNICNRREANRRMRERRRAAYKRSSEYRLWKEKRTKL